MVLRSSRTNDLDVELFPVATVIGTGTAKQLARVRSALKDTIGVFPVGLLVVEVGFFEKIGTFDDDEDALNTPSLSGVRAEREALRAEIATLRARNERPAIAIVGKTAFVFSV